MPFTWVTRRVGAKSRVTSAGTARQRVAKAVLISAIPPLMLQTPANPGGLPVKNFDERSRTAVLATRQDHQR